MFPASSTVLKFPSLFDRISTSNSSRCSSPSSPVSRTHSPFPGSLPSTPDSQPQYDPFAQQIELQTQLLHAQAQLQQPHQQLQSSRQTFARTVPLQFSSSALVVPIPHHSVHQRALFPLETEEQKTPNVPQSNLTSFSSLRSNTLSAQSTSYFPSAPSLSPSKPPPQASTLPSLSLYQCSSNISPKQGSYAASIPAARPRLLGSTQYVPSASRQVSKRVPPAASTVPTAPRASGMKVVPYIVTEVKPDSELYDPAVLRRLVLLTQAACPLDVNELNLRRCAINGDADGIEELLASTGVNPNAADTGGWSALILASRYGFLSAVQVLLKHGADINQETNEGWTALMYAVYNKHADIVRTLLEHHTPPKLEHGTKTNAGWTALMYATYIGSMEIMEILTSAYPPANILHETQKGASAITCARMKRRRDLRHFLEYNSIFQRKDLVVRGVDMAYGAWVPLDIARLVAEFTTFF